MRATCAAQNFDGREKDPCYSRFNCRYSHSGTGWGSADSPLRASRASFSSPSSTVSADAERRYHQHAIAGAQDAASLHGLLRT